MGLLGGCLTEVGLGIDKPLAHCTQHLGVEPGPGLGLGYVGQPLRRLQNGGFDPYHVPAGWVACRPCLVLFPFPCLSCHGLWERGEDVV